MNGKCPTCNDTINVPGRRGTKISDYRCPKCHEPLVGITAGRAKGRYLCPITGSVVTLGQTGVRLDAPHHLVFHAGVEFPDSHLAYHRTEPNDRERHALNRVADRILGTGCVVSHWYDPHRLDTAPEGFRAGQAARARLLLEPADAPGPGDVEVLVNAPLTYRKCAACGATTPDLPNARPAQPWKPRRTQVWLGRGRHNRHLVDIAPGPYPAGSLACANCRPPQRT